MDNYDVMAGGCANCVAADKEIDTLESRLTAADALATAVEQYEDYEADHDYYLANEIVDAARKYREVTRCRR